MVRLVVCNADGDDGPREMEMVGIKGRARGLTLNAKGRTGCMMQRNIYGEMSRRREMGDGGGGGGGGGTGRRMRAKNI